MFVKVRNVKKLTVSNFAVFVSNDFSTSGMVYITIPELEMIFAEQFTLCLVSWLLRDNMSYK